MPGREVAPARVSAEADGQHGDVVGQLAVVEVVQHLVEEGLGGQGGVRGLREGAA